MLLTLPTNQVEGASPGPEQGPWQCEANAAPLVSHQPSASSVLEAALPISPNLTHPSPISLFRLDSLAIHNISVDKANGTLKEFWCRSFITSFY